jgi:hypothetical protein
LIDQLALECAGPPTHTDPRRFAEELSAPEAIAIYCRTNQWQRLQEAKELERHVDLLFHILIAGGADAQKARQTLAHYRYRIEELRQPVDEQEIEITDPFILAGMREEDE